MVSGIPTVPRPRHARRGVSMIYALVAMVALTGFVSLAVDVGRVQIAKTELQQAADAAARYGASSLSLGTSTVKSRVAAVALENKVDGQGLVIDQTNDIEFGTWDPATKTFTVLTGSAQSGATALRITARRLASRNTGVPTLCASLLGRNTIDVKAVAIATRGKAVSYSVPADACPWLAGMPSGSKCDMYGGNTQDSVAPAQSPLQVTGIPVSAGTKFCFRQSGGTTGWDDGSAGTFGPDGDTSWIVQQQADNGINYTKAPINCLVGIFLDDRAPNTWSQGTAGDYSTSTSRNFSTLSPPLKQVFFIGDGLDASGNLQEFTVPTGATRFYLCIMDEKGWWWDNFGTLTTTMMDDNVQLVK